MRKPFTGADSSRRSGNPAGSANNNPADRQRAEFALERLSSDLKTLRIDYERFFSGGLTTPPEELRARISLQLRDLRASNLPGVAENFRLGSLEAQFNSYHEMYGRRLRDAEEGRTPRAKETRPMAARHDPVAGISLGSRLDREAVEALFVGLYQQRSPSVDLEAFQAYLVQQLAAIRQKTGCLEVQFRVAIEDGKPKLKAKPLTPATRSQT